MKKKQTINPEIFLPEQVTPQDERPKLYNLEEEFAKLKKNRNYFKSFLFILIIAGLFALTFYTIKFIQEKSSKITINIKDFEDLNLIDVLSSVKMYEKDLSKVKMELETLVSERDNRISILTETTNNKIKLINGAGYSRAIKQKKIKALKVDLWKQTQEIRKEYKDQITEKEQKINELTKKIESYDQNMLQQAKKNENILSMQDQLADLDMKSTQNEYEKKIQNLRKYYSERIKNLEDYTKKLTEQLTLKYNPIIEDDEILAILNESSQNIEEKLQMSSFQNQKVIDDETYLTIIENNKKLNLLLYILSQIPYKNSVPKLIEKINFLKKEIVTNYEQIGKNLADTKIELTQANEMLTSEKEKLITKNDDLSQQVNALSEKSKVIENQNSQYISILQKLLTKNNEQGYIIDAADPDNIFFLIKKDIKITNNQEAEILNNKTPIAKISFYYDNKKLKSKLISLYGDIKIQPLDTIKLIVPNE